MSAPAIKTAVVLQHTPTEGPGRLGALLGERGVGVSCRHVFAGDRVPGDLEPDEILIVMGGPMGVGDAGDRRFGFLGHEIALLRRLIAADRPVLGICLGAQLLASGGGARVYPNRRRDPLGNLRLVREVGWGQVDLIGAEREPALAGLGAREWVLHWHGDTFDPPAGAVHLASTPECPHQAFRLGARQFGLQFHCELDPDTIAMWAREDADFVRLAGGPGGGRRITADTAALFGQAGPAWDRLLRNIITVLLQLPGGRQ